MAIRAAWERLTERILNVWPWDMYHLTLATVNTNAILSSVIFLTAVAGMRRPSAPLFSLLTAEREFGLKAHRLVDVDLLKCCRKLAVLHHRDGLVWWSALCFHSVPCIMLLSHGRESDHEYFTIQLPGEIGCLILQPQWRRSIRMMAIQLAPLHHPRQPAHLRKLSLYVCVHVWRCVCVCVCTSVRVDVCLQSALKKSSGEI